MAATKEQERAALASIKNIVESLGTGSYIGMAFEGCFEIAEDNILNDFGNSMREKVKQAEEDVEYYHEVAVTSSKEKDKLAEENEKLVAELKSAKSKVMDKELYADVYNIVIEQKKKANDDIMKAVRMIATFVENSKARNDAIKSIKGLYERKRTIDKVVEKLEVLGI